jgi:protein TonB
LKGAHKAIAITSFTITESGTVENAVALEGYCGDPDDPNAEMRECSIFNSASVRASLKLKYKPKIVDGKPTPVENVLHRFTFIVDSE